MNSALGGALLVVMATNGAWAQTAATAEVNLKSKNITLPAAPTPVANYVTSVRVGNLLFLAGHGPSSDTPAGKVGKDLSVEQGYRAARSTA